MTISSGQKISLRSGMHCLVVFRLAEFNLLQDLKDPSTAGCKFLHGFQHDACPRLWLQMLLCDHFNMYLPVPAPFHNTCLGSFGMCLFSVGRKPWRAVIVYFEMSLKELTFQDLPLIFQPTVLLQHSYVSKVQCIQAEHRGGVFVDNLSIQSLFLARLSPSLKEIRASNSLLLHICLNL